MKSFIFPLGRTIAIVVSLLCLFELQASSYTELVFQEYSSQEIALAQQNPNYTGTQVYVFDEPDVLVRLSAINKPSFSK